MRDKIKDKQGASKYSLGGRAALWILGFALAGQAGLAGAERPYLLRDINEVEKGSDPYQLTPHGDRLFFWADDGMHGGELWVTDGTSERTVLVKDINPGDGASEPNNFTILGDRLLFSADDGTHGRELWVTDGMPEGTVLLKDINAGPAEAWGWPHFFRVFARIRGPPGGARPPDKAACALRRRRVFLGERSSRRLPQAPAGNPHLRPFLTAETAAVLRCAAPT